MAHLEIQYYSKIIFAQRAATIEWEKDKSFQFKIWDGAAKH